MLGGPQNSQVEPQNLSTSQASTVSQSMVMVPPQHTPQWVIHPQTPVHLMPYPTQGEGGNVPQTNNASTQVNPSHPPPSSQPGHLNHLTQEQLNQIPPQPLEHSIWSAHEMDLANGTNGGFSMEEIREREEDPLNTEEETKPKIKKEVRKKRKLADLLAEGIDPTKLEENSEQVRERFEKGCECEGDNCFKNMNPEFVFRHRLNIAELTKNEHDMYLMGVTMACLANPDETSRHKERKRLRASYVFQGKKVCLDAFLYLENCTHYQLKAIRKHVMGNGVTPRVHGNHGKKPPNTFPLDTYTHASAFLQSYISRYTPNSTPKKQNKNGKCPPVYLPSDITRKKIHNAYKEFCEHFKPNAKVMGYSSFRHFMKEQFHNVKFFRIDKKNERIAQSDDEDSSHNNGVIEPQQQPQINQEQRPEHRLDQASQQQVMQQQQQQAPQQQHQPPVQHTQDPGQQRPQEQAKETRNSPPTTVVSAPVPLPPNSHPVPVSMTHVPISSAYQGYSHVQLPLNLQTQQPLYSACMQPGVFPPGQTHPPQVRPTGFPYTNL